MTRPTIDFGIDLGTTNSEVAVLQGIKAEIIHNNEGANHTPSAVWIDRNGRLYVGQRAKDRVEADPENAFFEFKRQMGTDHEYCFQASGRRMKPEELSAEVLKSLKADVQQRLGEDLRAAVITVPAAFELPQCDATQRAARVAGIETSPLILEPTAAAMAYGFQSQSDKVFWLVYDLGGGTFDASLIQLRDGLFRIVNHKGDNYLGGKDLDWKIVDELFVPAIVKNLRSDDFRRGNPKWRGTFAKLKLASEEAKIQLSRIQSTNVYLDNLFRDRAFEFEYELTRGEVARLAEPLIRRTINISRDVLSEARLGAGNVEKLILVGGPTLAPYIREMLEDEQDGLGVPLEFSVDPFTVVAHGAAIFAGTQKLENQTIKSSGANEFTLDLEYQPVGSDEDPVVGGKVAAPDGMSLEGYSLEISRLAWKSGRVKLQPNGAFMTLLHAERGTQNVYQIALYNPLGEAVKVSPSSLSYIIGNAPTDPPIINPMGVALANNEVITYFEKGQTLPARHMESLKTTIGLHKGSAGELLRIPVIEGENQKADRNKLIGSLEIKGDKVRRDVPPGSEVEVTIIMDKSRILTIQAFILALDEEFEVKLDLIRKTSEPRLLQEGLTDLKGRLAVLQEKAEEAGDGQTRQGLQLIRDEKKIPELERHVAAAGGDQDACNEAQNRLLELQIALDRIEDNLKWPALVAEAEEEIRLTAELNREHGNAETRQAASALGRDIHQAIQAKEPDLLRRKIDDMSSLRFRILVEQPWWWVGYLQYLEENKKGSMTDLAQANRLFAEGRRAIDSNDLPKLKSVVRQLMNLLTEEEREAVSQGYGSTLTR